MPVDNRRGTTMQKAAYFLAVGLIAASLTTAWTVPSTPLWLSSTVAFFLGVLGGLIATLTFFRDR